MGLEKKKEERALFKNRISAATERRRGKEAAKKRPDLGEGGETVYVLPCMVVTFPTSQVERSPLKAPADRNTAPQQQRKVQGHKNGLKKKGERALFKNRISAATAKEEKGKRNS